LCNSVFNENVTATNVGWSFRINTSGEALTGISGSGTNTLTFTFVAAVDFADVLDFSYAQSTGDTIGFTSATELLDAANDPVTNNVLASAPLITSISVEDSTPTDLTVVFNKLVTATNVGWSFRINTTGETLNSISGSGTNTLTFGFTTTVIDTDTLDFSYTQSTGDTVAVSGGVELADATDQSVHA